MKLSRISNPLKVLICLAAAIIACLSLSSCAAQKELKAELLTVIEQKESYDAIAVGESELKFSLSLKDGVEEYTVLSPASLEGFKVRRKDEGRYYVNLRGIESELPSFALDALISFSDALSAAKEYLIEYGEAKSSNDGAEYNIELEGSAIKISLSDNAIKTIRFEKSGKIREYQILPEENKNEEPSRSTN